MHSCRLTNALPVVIALRGAKGAGKSAVARALSGRLGWPLVVTGDVLRRWALAANGSGDAETVRRVAEDARQTAHGVMGEVLQTVWPESGLPQQLIVDSVREAADVTSLRGVGYMVVLVTVSAPFEMRLARIVKRGRSDDALSSSGLRAHDRWERDLGRDRTRGDIDIEVKSDRMDRLVPRVLRKLREARVIDA